MKNILLFAWLLVAGTLFGQNVPIDEVYHIEDANTFDSSGAQVNAVSTPICDVYEEDTDTAILNDQNMTLRTAHTGEYRYSFTVSAANGFEVGKWYNVKCRATVGSVTQVANKGHFRVVAADATSGDIVGLSAVMVAPTAITGLSSQTVFNLTVGPTENDVINGLIAVITDSSTAAQKAQVAVCDYVAATKTVTLCRTPTFTIANGDTITIPARTPR